MEIITENKDKVEQLAMKLLEKEVIFREDLEHIFGKRPYEEERKRMEREAEEEMKKLRANNQKKSAGLPAEEEDKLLKEGKEEKGTQEKEKPVKQE